MARVDLDVREVVRNAPVEMFNVKIGRLDAAAYFLRKFVDIRPVADVYASVGEFIGLSELRRFGVPCVPVHVPVQATLTIPIHATDKDRDAEIRMPPPMPDPRSARPDDSQTFTCPKCASRVAAGTITCPHCGIDLALAAALIERMALNTKASDPARPFVGDVMLSRFGEFLMKTGYITQAQLEDALRRQKQMSAAQNRETLGQVLLDLKVMTREQLELASVEQVQELQNALRQVNSDLEQRIADRTRELEEAYRRLTELDRLKGNFVSNISHELRTPLTKIKGFQSLLAAGDLGPLSPDQREAVEVMGRGVAELDRLVGDLIQFASGARGEMVLRPSVVLVDEWLSVAMAVAGEKARARGIRLEYETAVGPGVAVKGDAEKLRWVVSQLLDNAIKFTPGGGRVAAGADLLGDRVRIWVEDTGPGISPDRLAELFQPFHQLDGSATRRQGGTGLGLRLVKMILEAHGTAASVDTPVGRGSRFTFELPVARG
jgi:signal transduction histidine kinase